MPHDSQLIHQIFFKRRGRKQKFVTVNTRGVILLYTQEVPNIA